jgi:hypothetical protein
MNIRGNGRKRNECKKNDETPFVEILTVGTMKPYTALRDAQLKMPGLKIPLLV